MISAATTANPFPCSPALAASIAAFKANKFVCCDIDAITSLALPMLLALVLVFRISSYTSFIDISLSDVFDVRSFIISNPSSINLITILVSLFNSSIFWLLVSIRLPSSLTLMEPTSVSCA